MTRKQRKQQRKKKKKEEGIIVDNELVWEWARKVTMQRPPVELVNKKVYCNNCKMLYCLAYDNTDLFCKDCYYKDCCQKEIVGNRVCQYCERL